MDTNVNLQRASWVLTTVGALNWGLKSLANFDLVAALFGRDTFLSRVVYGLVGVAGVFSLYHLVTRFTRPAARPRGFRVFQGIG